MEDQNDTQIDLAKVVKAIFRKLPVIGAITVIFALQFSGFPVILPENRLAGLLTCEL